MSRNNILFKLSKKFKNSYLIAFGALIMAVVLYSILHLFIPFTGGYYSGLALSVIMSLLIGFGLGSLVLVFNKEMKRQAEINKADNETKAQLIHILSHDIKSPLQNIAQAVAMAKSKDISREEFQSIMEKLEHDTNRTLALTKNLVQWIKIQKRNNLPSIEPHDIKQLIKETCELYTTLAERKNIRLDVKCKTNSHFSTDGEMYKIALRNLLSNALKYSTADSSIEVHCDLLEKQLITAVKDYGMGMKKEKLQEIFSGHSLMKSKPGTQKEQGTGIGLHLSKSVVEKLDGNIWAESAPEKGSIFYFSLPEKSSS